MDQEQSKAFMKVLLTAYSTYSKTAMAPETAELYLRCLTDLPYEAVQGAILSHISTNKWFPTIAELRDAAMRTMPGNQAPTALEAWDEVMREVGRIGTADVPHIVGREEDGTPIFEVVKPQFSHPAIERAANALGWQQICLSETIGVERAHFLKMYDTYVERQRQDGLMLPEVRELTRRLREGSAGIVDIKALAEAKRLQG